MYVCIRVCMYVCVPVYVCVRFVCVLCVYLRMCVYLRVVGEGEGECDVANVRTLFAQSFVVTPDVWKSEQQEFERGDFTCIHACIHT